MPRMILTKGERRDGARLLKPGDGFEVSSPSAARALQALGIAAPAGAELEAATPATKRKRGRPGRYATRRLQAED